jgi:hypothetical protein
MDVANEAYYLVDSNIKKLGELVDGLQTELNYCRHVEKINNGQFVQKQYEELLDFENFLSSKNIRD